jgi:pimeloyl-ACP methyl ester carboxylesterase
LLVDHPLISHQIFHPRRTRAEPTLIVEVPGARLACFQFRRHPSAGLLLYFHGNGETAAGCAEDYSEIFLDMGVNVCFAEYRGYGSSTGEPGLGAMLPDGEAILRALGVDPGQVVAFGRSLGARYAIELARRVPQLAGLILESGSADVLEALLPCMEELEKAHVSREALIAEIRQHFDLRGSLMNYKGGLLVLHAAHDQWLDRSHAQRLYDWGGGGDKKLVVFPEGNHNTILVANLWEYLREVSSFLQRVGVGVPMAKE